VLWQVARDSDRSSAARAVAAQLLRALQPERAGEATAALSSLQAGALLGPAAAAFDLTTPAGVADACATALAAGIDAQAAVQALSMLDVQRLTAGGVSTLHVAWLLVLRALAVGGRGAAVVAVFSRPYNGSRLSAEEQVTLHDALADAPDSQLSVALLSPYSDLHARAAAVCATRRDLTATLRTALVRRGWLHMLWGSPHFAAASAAAARLDAATVLRNAAGLRQHVSAVHAGALLATAARTHPLLCSLGGLAALGAAVNETVAAAAAADE
jgi:hypothetical protein